MEFLTDKKINEFERDVRRKVMTHLVVSGNQYLGAGLILVSVVVDIERMGDYTKNIYELAIQHPKRLSAGNYAIKLQEIDPSLLTLQKNPHFY